MKKQFLIGETHGRYSPQVLVKNGRSMFFRAAWFGLGAIFCAFSCLDASAFGFRLYNQDPEAIARGNAFVATADNPSAIYYNPAGITQLEGNNVSAGLYLISADTSFEPTAGGPGGESKTDFQPVPQFYYVYTPTNFPLPLSFGLGVYVPYGLSIDYGDSSAFQNVVQNGSLLYATVNPVVAWKVTPQLSLAIGPTINYSKANLNQGIPVGPGIEGQFHVVGDDYAFGFNGGALYQPCQYVSFGLNYHYSTTMNYRGHSSTAVPGIPALNASSPTSATLNFPQYVVFGFSVRPTTNWNFEFDADWTDWSNVKQITFNGTALGQPIPNLPLNYTPSWGFEWGVTRQLPHHYFVSAGYFFAENSVPNADYIPLVPDSDLHLFNVGVGHHGQRFGWALSYTLAIQPRRAVDNSVFDTGTPGGHVNGVYRTINNAINASVSMKF